MERKNTWTQHSRSQSKAIKIIVTKAKTFTKPVTRGSTIKKFNAEEDS